MAKFKGAIKVCGECGSEFKVPPSRAETALYCSNACAYKHRMAGRRKRVTLTCENCGKEFESVECHADRRRFCSHQCKNANASYLAERSGQFAGAANPMWKGGRTLHSEGYIYLLTPHHPFASNGYVFEHRLVMEAWLRENEPDSKFLIRLGDQLYLSPDFEVHHDDENRVNNAIGNLVCMTPEEHKRHHREQAKRQRR